MNAWIPNHTFTRSCKHLFLHLVLASLFLLCVFLLGVTDADSCFFLLVLLIFACLCVDLVDAGECCGFYPLFFSFSDHKDEVDAAIMRMMAHPSLRGRIHHHHEHLLLTPLSLLILRA